MTRSISKRFVAALLGLVALALGALAAAATPALDGTRSPQAVLAAGDADVVVALFSLPGCPYCEVVRRNYLRHLESEIPGVRVVEYGIVDERAFADTDAGAGAGANARDHPPSPAALAKSFGIRIAPTVVFLANDAEEVAERLVGYNSPDFYGAYLDRRITSALERAREP